MTEDTLKRGDTVVLLEKPTGYTSQHDPLTIGNKYLVMDFAGSCVITTSDDPNINAMFHRDRVVKIMGLNLNSLK